MSSLGRELWLVLAAKAPAGGADCNRDKVRPPLRTLPFGASHGLPSHRRALISALDREKGGAIMVAMDACNKRWGRGAVVPAVAGFAPRRKWSTKFQMRSPRYTTRVEEVPVIRAA